jgi:hypothetical protein
MLSPMPDDPTSDRARVRLVLMRELETINTYEEMAQRAEDSVVKNFFLHLALEEKEHVAEAVQMLQVLDGDQNKHFDREFEAGHFGESAPAAEHAAPTKSQLMAPAENDELLDLHPIEPHRVIRAVPAPPGGGSYTVGSLKRPR